MDRPPWPLRLAILGLPVSGLALLFTVPLRGPWRTPQDAGFATWVVDQGYSTWGAAALLAVVAFAIGIAALGHLYDWRWTIPSLVGATALLPVLGVIVITWPSAAHAFLQGDGGGLDWVETTERHRTFQSWALAAFASLAVGFVLMGMRLRGVLPTWLVIAWSGGGLLLLFPWAAAIEFLGVVGYTVASLGIALRVWGAQSQAA